MTAKADTHNTLFVVSINRLCYHWHGWNKMRPQSWRDTCCRLVGRWTTFTKGYLALLPCSSTARTGGRKWCRWNELIDLFQLGANCPDCWHEKKSGKEGGREEHGNSEFEQRYFKKIVVPHAIRVRSMKRTEPLVDGQYGPHPRAGIDFVFSQTQSSVIFKMNRAVQDFFVQFPYSICFPSNLLTINFNNCDISG